MVEQLITFDTAKLAKKKGFNIRTLYGVYGQKMKLTYNEPYELVNWNARTKQQPKSKATSIPTQSLLQKWLRDKCSINVEARSSGNSSKYFFRIKEYPINKIHPDSRYNSYEKALEEGLKIALTLINTNK